MRHFAVAIISLGILAGGAQAQLSSSHQRVLRAPETPVKTATGAVVARVNGVGLPQEMLDRAMRRLFPYYSMHGGAVPKAYEPEIRQKAMDTIIRDELVFQEARRRKMAITPSTWQRRLREAREEFNSDDEYRAAVKQYFGTQENFERIMRRDMIIERLWDMEVKRRANVSDIEVAAFYKKNQAHYRQPESIAFQTISFNFGAGATAENKASARKKAEAALSKARAAKNYEEFGVLAEKVSEDDWRVMMGDHKSKPRGDIPAEFAGVLSVQEGQTSDIVEGPTGYHIFRVNKVDRARALPLVEVKGAIRSMLQKQRAQERAKAFEQSLRKSAKIQVL